MPVRYIASRDFYVADKNGRKRFFKSSHRGRDGFSGYTSDEVKGLYRDHMSFFKKVEVQNEIVEQATAAPGEKRSRKPKADDGSDE